MFHKGNGISCLWSIHIKSEKSPVPSVHVIMTKLADIFYWDMICIVKGVLSLNPISERKGCMSTVKDQQCMYDVNRMINMAMFLRVGQGPEYFFLRFIYAISKVVA